VYAKVRKKTWMMWGEEFHGSSRWDGSKEIVLRVLGEFGRGLPPSLKEFASEVDDALQRPRSQGTLTRDVDQPTTLLISLITTA
jgi:hypothetical protein